MKKLLLFTVVLGAISFTSCSKKDYTCVCETKALGNTQSVSNVLENVSKSEAEEACNRSVTTSISSTVCAIE